MFIPSRPTWAVALALAALLTARPALRAQAPGEPPPVPTENEINPPPPAPPRPGESPPVPDGDVIPQQRGPVHEAFARPADKTPMVGPVVPRQPPAPIPEVPPDQKPEGDNVIWVPGYWAWDAGRNDFLWVSGCWRVPPPGRKWVPGYWTQADGQWQWVSGLWAPAGQDQLPYQPPPPDSLDNGPDTPAPDDNSFYVPGCWVYQDTRYLWRPGYWSACRPGYVWSPASYCATPSGCVFVDGYWDYPLDDRGLLFAPVCFNGTPWAAPGWCYRPRFCVGPGGLLSSLWVGPSRCGYFFGDYFGPRFRGLGFTPWFAGGRGYANPLFGYYRWANRGNPGWSRGLYNAYRGPHAGALARAPFVQPLGRLAGSHSLRLTHLSPTQFNHQRDLGRRFTAAGRQRQQWEARGAQRAGRPALPPAHTPAGPTAHGRVTAPPRVPHAIAPAHVRPSYAAYGRSPAAQPQSAPRAAAGVAHHAPPRPSPRQWPSNPNLVPHAPARHAPVAHPAAAPRVAHQAPRPAPAAARRPAVAPRPAAVARPHPQVVHSAPRPAPHVARPAPPAPHRAAPAPRPAAHVAHSAPHPAPHPAPASHGGHRR
jgi:hypothetical protein